MTIAQRIETKSPISIEEMERRREVVRQAVASSRIEGAFHDVEMDPVFDAYIRGEIDARQIVPRLNELRRL